MRLVTGLFRDRSSAERAYQSVVARGYEASDVSLVMSDETRHRCFADEGQLQKSAASKLGGPLGGSLGTVGAALAALSTVAVLPGLGIVVAGPIAAALVAAGSVGLAGGVITALTHWGIPEARVEQYGAAIREGGILMGVMAHSDEDAAQFEQQWRASGGEHVYS